MTISTSLHCFAKSSISASMNSFDISLAYPPTPSPDSFTSTSNGSAPNDLNCSRAAGLTIRTAILWSNYLSKHHHCRLEVEHPPLLYLLPGIKSSDNGSHWLGCPCCCQTRHSTSNNQHLGGTINISMKCCARGRLYLCARDNTRQQESEGYLRWWDLSCSSDLTSEKSAKVVRGQNYSLVPAKQTFSSSLAILHPPTPFWKEIKISVPSNVSHGAEGIIALCNGHSGHLVHGQHRALPLRQLLHQLRVLRWVNEAHQGGFRLQEVHFTQTWSSNLYGRQRLQNPTKLTGRDVDQPWGPGLIRRLPSRR